MMVTCKPAQLIAAELTKTGAIPQRRVLYKRLSAARPPINQCLSGRNTYMEDGMQRVMT